MKVLGLIVSLIFLCSSCVIGTMSIKKVDLDQNNIAYQLRCEEWFGRCFSKAKKKCPNGYDILYSQVTAKTYKWTIYEDCRKDKIYKPFECEKGKRKTVLDMEYDVLDLIISCKEK